jgi:pyruvate dehydrogenase E1 component alpha subunit
MTVKHKPQFLPRDKPVKPIGVLDQRGKLKDGAKPGLGDKELLEALRLMMLARAFDARCFSLQRQGKLGTFAPIVGQEAAILGSALALDPKRDWVVPQYRELPAMLRQGIPLDLVALQRQGHPAGTRLPEGVNVVQTQVSLAAQIPHAVGLAWGLKHRGSDGVVIVYFGDGASSEGDFHESCNLAGVVKAPVIFLLQPDGRRVTASPGSRSTATTSLPCTR